MANKYKLLEDYLRDTPSGVADVALTFRQIAEILGSELPKSAQEHRPWWANPKDVQNRPQAQAWLAAGFSVDSVNLGADGRVRFRRSGPAGSSPKSPAAPARQPQRSGLWNSNHVDEGYDPDYLQLLAEHVQGF